MAEHQVATLKDLVQGSMQTVQVGDQEVLLVRHAEGVSALHSKCTHYGAPLIDGVLNGHRIMCPWHHACFDARTGRHLEAPGCDALQSYPVSLRDGKVFVELPSGKSSGQVPNPMARPATEYHEDAPIVVVGGGPAGQHAVEGLRQGGYTGPIALVSAETHLPYDRTQVSKGYLSGQRPEEKMPLRNRAFYKDLGVDLRLGRRLTKIDAKAHELRFDDDTTLAYSKLCLATGSKVRRLSVPGANLAAVYTMRNKEDAEAIRKAAGKGKRAVVIGASFIGMEAADALRSMGCHTTVVAPDELPFGKLFGQRVGTAIRDWHEEKGIRFKLGEQVQSISGVRKATGVVLESGEELRAHFVVVGIGVEPALDFEHPFRREEDGGLRTDNQLHVGKDVWAVGDIASAPYAPGRRRARIEHWRVAEQHGTVAGNAMAGSDRHLLSVPYFWTSQAGNNLRYAGHHERADNIVFDGNPGEGPFLAFYIEGSRVAAVLGYKRDRDVAAIHELMWLGKMPKAGKLNLDSDWPALLLH